jgi:uncharacterized protein (TIGR03032 family)
MWRDPAEVVSLHRAAASFDHQLLTHKTTGDFWGLLQKLGITLLVSREYEHFVLALTVRSSRPFVTYMPLPHPSGIAIDRPRNEVFIASTRNPNQIFTFRPLVRILPRRDRPTLEPDEWPLMPVAAQFLPGSLYIHELAKIGATLYANSVGQNAIVRIKNSSYEFVWWPRNIERRGVPDFNRNYIQLNSIAAGASLEQSFFTASSDTVGTRLPGHRNYPVNRRGVIFSGATRKPIVHGLTRPHSARLWSNRLWVNNSGYGEFGVVGDGMFVPVARLPGWTRGLAFYGGYAFVGVSRIIPRFSTYAPGLDVSKSVCGVYAVELNSGKVEASVIWPAGNQIFAVDWIAVNSTTGFPYLVTGRNHKSRLERLFYAYSLS